MTNIVTKRILPSAVLNKRNEPIPDSVTTYINKTYNI